MGVLFAFGQERRAILLASGGKSGDWAGWHARSILIAGGLSGEHQAALAARQPAGQRRVTGQRGRPGNR